MKERARRLRRVPNRCHMHIGKLLETEEMLCVAQMLPTPYVGVKQAAGKSGYNGTGVVS